MISSAPAAKRDKIKNCMLVSSKTFIRPLGEDTHNKAQSIDTQLEREPTP